MSSEIQFTGSLYVYKSAVMKSPFTLAVNDLLVDMSGNNVISGTILLSTSPTAFPIGQIASVGWCGFFNQDTTNYITIRNGSGGADTIQLMSGEAAFFPFRSTGTPYGMANTAACRVDFLIIER